MFDNTQSNFNPSNKNLDDLNQGKNYPFKSVSPEKKLSGLKGPIEDILAGSETDLSVGHLPTEQNNIDGLGLKEIPTVPSMTERVAKSSYNQIDNNNMVVGAPPLPSQKKGKFFIILIVLLIVVIFGLAGFFAYNYLIKNKTAPPTLTPNESLQELMKSLNEEKQNENVNDENVNQENKDSEPVTPTAPVDSDSDGLSDEQELELGTNPKSFDTDNDGLNDLEEVDVYKTDPAIKDTDSDGYDDGTEVKNGYDPAKPGNAKLNNLQTYTNNEYGFEIKYPKSLFINQYSLADTREIIELKNDYLVMSIVFSNEPYFGTAISEKWSRIDDKMLKIGGQDFSATRWINKNKIIVGYFLTALSEEPNRGSKYFWLYVTSINEVENLDINFIDQILSTFKFLK